MSDIAIRATRVSKMYKMFKSRRDQVIDLLGVPFFTGHHDEFWALRDLDLVVPRGGKIGIIGHNGAGKSTLLKIIAGQVTPSSGQVEVNGRVQALMELGTGFHPEFTGRENVFSALSYQGIVGAAARRRFDEIVEFSELEEFIDNPVKTYSAGMYARLAFSVATAIEPEILIIDEVLGAGDAYFAGKCVDRMNEITQKEGATILFVSHDASSVLRLCDRSIWMKKGRCIMDGPAHEVVKEYVDAMRFETELRHRSREMHLGKGTARGIMASSDAFKKFLFRFKVTGEHPQRNHLIRRITLQKGESTLSSLDVGDAMDNAIQEPNYIISEKAATDWSQPIQDEVGFARLYCDCRGTEQHAPFVLSVPAYLRGELPELVLAVEGDMDAREEVFVEIWDDAGHYTRIGTLNDQCNGRYVLPLSGRAIDETETPSHRRSNAGSKAQSQTEDEFSQGRVLAITRVELTDSTGTSKRVFPMGTELDVTIHYEAFREVTDPVFAVTFHRLDGVQMDHKNSKLLNFNIGTVSGTGVAKFSFSPLRLGPGEYLVTAAILKYLDIDNWIEQPPSYDRHDRRYSFSVFSTLPGAKNLGAVFQDCSFIFTN